MHNPQIVVIQFSLPLITKHPYHDILYPVYRPKIYKFSQLFTLLCMVIKHQEVPNRSNTCQKVCLNMFSQLQPFKIKPLLWKTDIHSLISQIRKIVEAISAVLQSYIAFSTDVCYNHIILTLRMVHNIFKLANIQF